MKQQKIASHFSQKKQSGTNDFVFDTPVNAAAQAKAIKLNLPENQDLTLKAQLAELSI